MRKKVSNQAAAKDFVGRMLPMDRKALFYDCLRQRPDIFRKLALILLLSFLPVFTVNFISNIAYSNMLESDLGDAVLLAFYQISAAIKIPCYIIIGLAFASISRILRQLIWGEPIFFFFHLKMGLRQNGKRFALVFAMAGVIRFLCSFSPLQGNSFLVYLPSLLSSAILLPIGLYILSQTIIYDVTFRSSFSNGLALYISSIPPTLGFTFVICLLGSINLIPFLLARIILSFLAVCILPVFALAWLLFSCHVFDKTINPIHYPELIGRGLFDPSVLEDEQV